MKALIRKVTWILLEQRGDFVQNAIYLALVVIFGISVIGSFGEAIVAKFQDIIQKFSDVSTG